MKIWFDTEFIEDGKTIEPISIGMVREDGAEYYAEFEFNETWANDWVKANVLPHLDGVKRSRAHIAGDILDFVKPGGEKPEFWAYYCVAPETRILTADLRWESAGDLQVGDRLVGFDEHRLPGTGRSAKWRQYRGSEVLGTRTIEKPCYRLVFDDDTKVVCSVDHKWLTADADASRWLSTDRLRLPSGKRSGSVIARPVPMWGPRRDYDAGYLSAAFDGEGHISQGDLSSSPQGIRRTRLGFAQRDNEMLAEVRRLLAKNGYKFTESTSRIAPYDPVARLSIGGRSDFMRFLGEIRPGRLLRKFDPDSLGAMSVRSERHGANYHRATLVAKEFIGTAEVVALETSTRTFIAEGLASHNCSYDWVLLCQLYGRMIDLPDGWPMYCRDLKQLTDSMGNPKLPGQTTTEHHALADARWTRDAHLWLLDHGR